MSRLMRLIATTLALVSMVAACSSGGASKAGGEEPPIVLKIGTNDWPGRVAADQVQYFAARVAALSEGGIRIEPVWRVGGDDISNWDQFVARQVVAGDLDMGNVPARAFDTEGVTSLTALSAPFLITSDEVFDDVLSSELQGDMLAGLGDIGLVGLSVLPESLRHPFGFDQALLGPDDYAGGSIRAPASATTTALFEALGGKTVDDHVDPTTQIGMESAYIFEPPGTATGNVVLYAKANVLFVNADVFDGLEERQREILRQAASETVPWSIDSRDSDSAAAAKWCATGGRIVDADAETLAALQTAVEPVNEQLRADELTAKLMDQIEQIKMSVPVAAEAIPDGCSGERAAPEPVVAEGTDDPSVINGSYRLEWDGTELYNAFLEAGAAENAPDVLDQLKADTENNAGVVIFTFEDGKYQTTWETGFSAGDNCPGTYGITGNRITMVGTSDRSETDCLGDDIGAVIVDAAWELTDQALVLSDFHFSEEIGPTWWYGIFISKPLAKVD